MRIRFGRARVLPGLTALLVGAGIAGANGRPPRTTAVHSRPGNDGEIYVAATFGLLISKDDGCTFRWVCEENIGYGGTFDPKYKIAADGTIFATTFNGLRISRDGGCSFQTATEAAPADDPGRFANKWVDAIDLSRTGDVWVGTAASGADNDVYRSTDGGRSFVARGQRSATMWWKSVKVAPSRPQRVYLTGYQVTGPQPPRTEVHVTDDGGDNWSPRPLDGVQLNTTPLVMVEAIDPQDPDRLFLRSAGSNPPGGDRLYRSDNGGQAWREVLVTSTAVNTVLFRPDGSIWVATDNSGMFRSADGVTFVRVDGAPTGSCLDQRADGDLFTCGTNWEPDGKAIARSTDGATWTKAFRFVDLAGPVMCPQGTPQRDVCEAQLWPALREQFGARLPACAGGGGVDAAPSPEPPPGDGGGCCNSGGRAATALFGLGLWSLWAGRRRVSRRRA